VEAIPGRILDRIRVSFSGKKENHPVSGVVFPSFGLASALQRAGERCGTRTHDTLIKSQVLYH
jgi:hypothetical protein